MIYYSKILQFILSHFFSSPANWVYPPVWKDSEEAINSLLLEPKNILDFDNDIISHCNVLHERFLEDYLNDN